MSNSLSNILFAGVLGIVIYKYAVPARSAEGLSSTDATCPGCKAGEKEKKLQPILEPLHNVREMCKQLLLLEDHLFQPQRRCKQCIRKHFLTTEALAEEAITLDIKHANDKLLQNIPKRLRQIQSRYIQGEDPAVIAQELRDMRKDWSKISFDKF